MKKNKESIFLCFGSSESKNGRDLGDRQTRAIFAIIFSQLYFFHYYRMLLFSFASKKTLKRKLQNVF
jgi:hypothetical protein